MEQEKKILPCENYQSCCGSEEQNITSITSLQGSSLPEGVHLEAKMTHIILCVIVSKTNHCLRHMQVWYVVYLARSIKTSWVGAWIGSKSPSTVILLLSQVDPENFHYENPTVMNVSYAYTCDSEPPESCYYRDYLQEMTIIIKLISELVTNSKDTENDSPCTICTLASADNSQVVL